MRSQSPAMDSSAVNFGDTDRKEDQTNSMAVGRNDISCSAMAPGGPTMATIARPQTASSCGGKPFRSFSRVGLFPAHSSWCRDGGVSQIELSTPGLLSGTIQPLDAIPLRFSG